MQRTIQLPTGPHPGWELEEDGAQLRTVSESLVVLQSLRQSRSRWVTSMFPKFSTKGRGSKAMEIVPPPHTIKAHGKYDLHIGPHVFSGTAIYEVHYLPPTEPSSGNGAQPTTNSSSIHPVGSGQVQTSAPPITFPSISYVTPAMSSQVAAAAQSDPILANLLHAVINRTATDDQVATLGLLIRSLEGMKKLGAAEAATSANVVPPPHLRADSPKPFDIIIEFHERPSDRWIFPRGDVYCERPGIAVGVFSRVSDVIITTSLPFFGAATEETIPLEGQPSADTREVASFRFSRVPPPLWDLFLAWAGGPEKMEESKTKLAEMAKHTGPSLYLQHRLPDGELLTEIESAVAPPHTMKSIKPPGADSNRAKRKSISRKATLVSGTPPSPGEKTASVKRRQQLKAKVSAPPPISCRACGQTDVPLMMGGRYCRTCIDVGKAVVDIPQVPPKKSKPTPPAPTLPSDSIQDIQAAPSPSNPALVASQ